MKLHKNQLGLARATSNRLAKIFIVEARDWFLICRYSNARRTIRVVERFAFFKSKPDRALALQLAREFRDRFAKRHAA